jgi:hypothetical protein
MSLDSDLNTLGAYLADFETYLKSETVFWNVGANLPALTPGAMIFLRHTLAARRDRMVPAQQARFAQLESLAESLFSRWPVNIEKKALREISQRLNVWANALEEPGANYGQSVQNRVYLALLLPRVERQEAAGRYRTQLAALDSRLRSRFQPGDFTWEADLAPAFPRDAFWFLYGKPKAAQ